MIPCIQVGSLFEGDSSARAGTDAELLRAAEQIGFIQVTGLHGNVDISTGRRTALKRVFGLPAEQLRSLWRQKFAPDHHNVYRGWFPLQEGHTTCKEGIDMGPDVVAGFAAADQSDPLCEDTPLPREGALPGWRRIVASHYTEMTHLGQVLMRSLARGLGLHENHFDALFHGGISTLRLIHYPHLPDCDAPRVVGAAHVDSGLVTLLLQDGVGGLQVQTAAASFADVPVREDAVTVNFGRLLALWSGGRIRATQHRVVGGHQSRFSMPFFYEPRVDALIAPLPGCAQHFTAFQYGDFLWQASTRFIEFRGLEHRRPARGNASAALAAVV